MVIAFVIAAAMPYIIKRRKQVKTGIPYADERVKLRFLKISLSISSVFGSLGVIALAVLTLLGKEVLEIRYVWLYLLLFVFSLSMAAVISSKK